MSAEAVRRLVRAMLLAQFGGLAFFIAGSHNAFVKLPKPTTTDFASFYSAGLLADRGKAGAAYDAGILRQTGQAAIAPGITFNPFLNPPVFLLICAPLARLPYLLAFVVFELVSVLIWLAVTTRIAGGGRLAAMCLAAVPSVWWVIGWGQNGFVSGALMGAGTLLLRRRPFWAGVAFGALIFKPHFGILLPVALLAGRRWRAIGGALAGAACLSALSALLFGVSAWEGFFGMALRARETIESGSILFQGHVDVAGAARLLGASAGLGWMLQGLASAVAAICVACVWWPRPACGQPDACPGAHDAQLGAVLVAGTLMAMPFLLFYDLTMGAVAAAWLVRAARQRGWLRGESAALIGLAAIDMLAFPVASLLHVAIGAAVAPGLLGLALRRNHHETGGEQSMVESQK
jgi:hypothetical protein